MLIKRLKKSIVPLLILLLIFGAAYFANKQKDRFFDYDDSNSVKVHVRTYPGVMVENLWISYRSKIQDDGRTIDRSRNYLTTSEGQSYSLLRSVWMDDKREFDQVLKWTRHNLQKRPNDKLFAWKWGQDDEGKWDVLTNEGGLNTASDADQDIALALIFAYKRWNQDDYLEQAQLILADIWRQEVLTIGNNHYLLAGNWAKGEEFPTINPSYFSFMAYPIFAEVDPARPWMELSRTSYEVLSEITFSDLGHGASAGLPPDWVALDPTTEEILPPVHDDKSTHFADDAFRVFWRVGLDWKWHESLSAQRYLGRSSFLEKEYLEKGLIYSSYTHTGEPETDYESLSLYGGILPDLMFSNPEAAEALFFEKLVPLYDQDIEDFRSDKDIGYYAQNWVWFGMAFYEGKLQNLFQIE